METISEVHHHSRSLPQVVSKDRQTSPDNGSCTALRQHSTQAELAFKHTDRGFYAAAKALQLPKLDIPINSATHSRALRPLFRSIPAGGPSEQSDAGIFVLT
jgi:hypothetical protein